MRPSDWMRAIALTSALGALVAWSSDDDSTPQPTPPGSGGTQASGGAAGAAGGGASGAAGKSGGGGVGGGGAGAGGTAGASGRGGTGASGGTGGASGAGGTHSGQCSMHFDEDPECLDCMVSQCDDECYACETDTNCLILLDCLGTCTDDACSEACFAENEAGLVVYLDWIGYFGCRGQSCAVPCEWSPDPDCLVAASCLDCCNEAHPQGLSVYQSERLNCLCQAEVCLDECGDSLCAGQPSTSGCDTCRSAAMSSGGACVDAVVDACFDYPDCFNWYLCVGVCPAD